MDAIILRVVAIAIAIAIIITVTTTILICSNEHCHAVVLGGISASLRNRIHKKQHYREETTVSMKPTLTIAAIAISAVIVIVTTTATATKTVKWNW